MLDGTRPEPPSGYHEAGHRLAASPGTVKLHAEVGQSAIATVTLTNPGSEPITLGGVDQQVVAVGKTVRPVGDFSIRGLVAGLTVPPGGTAPPVVITFQPQRQLDGDNEDSTLRKSIAHILDPDMNVLAEIHLDGHAIYQGGTKGSADPSVAERFRRYDQAMTEAWDRGDHARAHAINNWSAYMSAAELEKYKEEHPGFDLKLERYQKYYPAQGNGRRDSSWRVSDMGAVDGQPISASSHDEYASKRDTAGLENLYGEQFLLPIQGAVVAPAFGATAGAVYTAYNLAAAGLALEHGCLDEHANASTCAEAVLPLIPMLFGMAAHAGSEEELGPPGRESTRDPAPESGSAVAPTETALEQGESTRTSEESASATLDEPATDAADPAEQASAPTAPTRELGLRSRATAAIERLENIKENTVGDVNSEADHNHYDAARREASGEVVARRPDGQPFDHIRELQEAYNGLDSVRESLQDELRRPPETMTERGNEVVRAKLKETHDRLSRLKGFLHQIGFGPPFPPFHEWPPGT